MGLAAGWHSDRGSSHRGHGLFAVTGRRLLVHLRFGDLRRDCRLVERYLCMQARSRQHEAEARLPAEQHQHGDTGFHAA